MTCFSKYSLKRHFLLVVLSCFVPLLSAQVVQVGRITELNSDGKPIIGASALCLSATDVQPATTDNNGIFLLSFKKHLPGDIVYNLRITKPGFEIVNAQVLKSGIILTEKDTLKIVMVRPEQLAEARAHYYDIIDHYHVDQHEAIIARLQKELEAAKITAAEYEQRATEAEQQLAKALEQAEHYADLFSRINRDDLDAVSRAAFQALSEGDIGRAIKIYEDADAFGKMKEKIAQRDDAVQALVILEKQVLNEADLRLAIGGDENIQRASDIYRTVAYSDSTSVTKCIKYIQFLIIMGRFDEAYAFADEAFQRDQTDPGPISAVYQELGKIAQTQNNFNKAKQYLRTSLQYAEQVEDDYYRAFRRNYPLHMLGLTYYRMGEIDSSLYCIEQAMQCRKIMLEHDTIYRGEYANECNSLAMLYKQKKQYQEALTYAKEAVEIADTICRFDPSYHPCYAAFANTMALIYWPLGQTDSTDYYFRKCLDIWENQTPYISNFFKKNYIDCIISNAKFNVEMNRLEDARKLYEKALAAGREGYEFSPETFRSQIVMILNNLAQLSKTTGNEAEERRYREEAESYRK